MDERTACARLKLRFEQAGFRIAENIPFDEDGVRFEIDGFDAAARVGYEYVTGEAGDGWDVDADVIAALAARRARGELHILVVDEAAAPDAAALDRTAAGFLAELRDRGVTAKPAPAKPAPGKPAPAAKPAAAKPAAKKPPPTPARKAKPKKKS